MMHICKYLCNVSSTSVHRMFWVPDHGRLVNKEVLVPEVLTLNCFGGFYGYFALVQIIKMDILELQYNK